MPKGDGFLERKQFTIERLFKGVTPERVWDAWTDPEQAARWMWGGMTKNGWAEIDLRVGGAYRVYSEVEGGRHEGTGWSGMLGFFAVVEPHARLIYTGHWDANVFYNQDGKLAPDEIIDVTFEAVGDDTKVTVSHRGIPDIGDAAKHHEIGFKDTLNHLEKLLAGS